MKPKTNFFLAIFLLAAMMFIHGCGDSGTDPVQPVNGSLILKLTDAPFPIDLAARAEVTIDLITIKSQADSSGDSAIAVFNETATYNLLDLRNGITETLAQVEIPEGIYNQIRLRVVDAEIELTDGQVFNLNIPSGTQTGIKVNIHPFLQINADVASEILLDFDLEKSFVMRGNRNNITGFNFKPVIRAVNNSDAGKFFGNIVDTNGLALENIRVWAEQDSVVSSTYSNASGDYSLIGIPSGTYKLSAEGESYQVQSFENLILQSGGQVHQNFQLTPQ